MAGLTRLLTAPEQIGKFQEQATMECGQAHAAADAANLMYKQLAALTLRQLRAHLRPTICQGWPHTTNLNIAEGVIMQWPCVQGLVIGN